MGASPVARAKRMAGCPDCPATLCGWMVNTGALHWPGWWTVTTAVALLSSPQGLTTSTQYDLVCVSAGVVKVGEVAPGTGTVLSGALPSYHCTVNGPLPVNCTARMKLWPELMVPPAGCWVTCGGVHSGGACGVTVAVLLSTVLQLLVTRTQYFFTELMGGVVKVALVAPETGLEVSGFTPSYH